MKTKDLVMIALAICLLTISAQFKLQLYIVPFSLQFMTVLLLSLCLPVNIAFTSILLYIFIGLLGIPVFATGGGLLYITKASFGFLLGFLAIPVICHWSRKQKGSTLHFMIRTGFLCWLTLYAIALPYCYMIATTVLMIPLTWNSFFWMFCLAFLPGDSFVIITALLLAKRISSANKLQSSKEH